MTVSRYTQLKAQTVGLYCLLWRQCGQLKRSLGSIPEMKNNDLRSLCTTNILVAHYLKISATTSLRIGLILNEVPVLCYPLINLIVR